MGRSVFFKKMTETASVVFQNLQFLKLKVVTKLKEMALDIIYRLYTSVEDVLLKKFFVEFEFYTPASRDLQAYNKKHRTSHLGDFRCYLPLIVKVKSKEEADWIALEFRKQLEQDYKLSVVGTTVHKEFGSEAMLNTYIQTAEAKFKGYKRGSFEFRTYTYKKDIEPKEYVEWGDPRIDIKEFRYIKTGPSPVNQNWEYVVSFRKTNYEE